jgi:IS5 family transposase
LLEQQEQTGQKLPEEVIYDRAGRREKTIKGVKIKTLTKPKRTTSQNKKRRRAGINGIISHLKDDHRMAGNYLHRKIPSKTMPCWRQLAGI